MNAPLRAPFPWFGGKSRCAPVVWRALGNVPNYVEPFFGSGAVLLSRPHTAKIETVNDRDAYLSNFWRAIAADPDAVAKYADWPVNEADLHARHAFLLAQLEEHRTRMLAEPEYFDAQYAGWWVWGLSMWIGSGWCTPTHRNATNEPRPDLDGIGQGVHKKAVQWFKRPVLGHGGRGVVAPGTGKPQKRPLLSNGGVGVSARGEKAGGPSHKMPDLYTRGHGRGTRAAAPEKGGRIQIPALQGGGRGVTAPSRLPNLGSERGLLGADAAPCTEWFRALQERLRRVRVCCGDFERVLGDSVTGMTRSRNSGMNPCGVFLDPPYSHDYRDKDLYASDAADVGARAAAWAREHGTDKDIRIVLCGYEGDHQMPGWTVYAWKALRGYGGADNDNRHKERLWLSPHCLPLLPKQRDLFVEEGGA